MYFNKVIFLASIGLVVLLASLSSCQDSSHADHFCLHDCSGRRNGKDHYANPDDCHSFYQCFFYSDTNVTGILRQCPPGLYFNDKFLACVHEGPFPCADPCLNSETSSCYPYNNSCRSYIACAAAGSNVLCCPEGTHFNATSCGCDADSETSTCTDSCNQIIPAEPTSTIAPQAYNDTTCIDSYGNFLTNGSTPGEYQIIDPATGNARTLACAAGTTFSLQQCLCGDFTPEPVNQPNTVCNLYLPFNGDTADYSSTHASVFLYDDVEPSSDDATGGSGSLVFNGGSVEIPATKTLDLSYQGSWCLFFRCSNDSCSNGGVWSNNNNENSTNYVFILAVESGNVIRAKVSLLYPTSFVELTGNATAGWNQVCVVVNGTYDSTGEVYLYVNNQRVATAGAPTSWTNVANCPYTLGNDQAFGSFYGNLDNVLMCRAALTPDQVNAHNSGSLDAMRQASMIP